MSLYSRSPNAQVRAVRFLKNSPLFESLPDQDLEEAAHRLRPRTYDSGVTLFHQDMPGSTLYLIESGCVRVFAVGLTGQEHTFDIFGPGDFFGELSLLDGKFRSATAITLDKTGLWLLPKEALEEFLIKYQGLTLALVKALAGRVRASASHMESIIFHDVLGRLAVHILNLTGRYGKSNGHETVIEIPLSQADLGTIVGATRESVNKGLSVLRKWGLVKIDCGLLTVLDPRGLRDVIYQRGR
jgi:CRP/FNR family cyclic AMP-dependent transcriptional regulator